jgi:predicted transcriptional regulator
MILLGGLMPCVTPDGKPTSSGKQVLDSLKATALTPEEIASIVDQPLFKVRSSLRELKAAEWLTETEGKYKLTEQGKNVLQ